MFFQPGAQLGSYTVTVQICEGGIGQSCHNGNLRILGSSS